MATSLHSPPTPFGSDGPEHPLSERRSPQKPLWQRASFLIPAGLGILVAVSVVVVLLLSHGSVTPPKTVDSPPSSSTNVGPPGNER
jgi:hypothetical protein